MIDALNRHIEANRDDMINSLAEMVRIPSVRGDAKNGAPYGDESRRAMQYALDLGKKMGFEVIENIDDKVCYIEYGSGERVVGSFAHLDVVPAGENWTYPPFGGEIHDGRMYGRGTVDNKAPFLASLYGMYAIKQSGLKLNARIRVVGGTCEETGMEDMDAYVARCGAPNAGFTPDGWFPMSFTERGVSYWSLRYPLAGSSRGPVKLVSLHGGAGALNLVADSADAVLQAESEEEAAKVIKKVIQYNESSICSFTAEQHGNQINISASGLVAHACAPFDGRNAISDLLMLLHTLALGGSLGTFLSFYAKKIGMTTDGSLMGMKRSDECGQLTFNLSKMDIEGEEIRWVVNIRYPHTYKDDVFDDYKAVMQEGNITIENISVSPSLMYSLDSPLIKTLRRVYEDVTGLDSTPGNGGGTYAKCIPNIVAFGNQFPGSVDWCHRSDESLDMDEFVLQAKIYGHALYELANTEE